MERRALAVLLISSLICGCCDKEDAVGTGRAPTWPVEVRLFVPKAGRIGGTPMGMPSLAATLPEHFEERILRIERVEKREILGAERVVFAITGLDVPGTPSDQVLYFAYMDVNPEGAALICRLKDDGESVHEELVRKGIPFPLTCSRPPDLGFRLNPEKDGYWLGAGRGVLYRRQQTAAGCRVEASYFQLAKCERLPTARRSRDA